MFLFLLVFWPYTGNCLTTKRLQGWRTECPWVAARSMRRVRYRPGWACQYQAHGCETLPDGPAVCEQYSGHGTYEKQKATPTEWNLSLLAYLLGSIKIALKDRVCRFRSLSARGYRALNL